MIRILAIVAAMVATTPAAAGFVAIDGFSDPLQSDGLGDRTTEGLVTFLGDGLTMSAYAVSGATDWAVASVIYRFVPTPLVAAPIVRVLARNDQTHVAETGILRVSVDGESISYVLPGGQQSFVPYSFDFRSVLSDVSAMQEIRLDWLREDGHGGAKQLVIDSIDVNAVPEPSTLGLIGLAAGGAWIARRKNGNKLKGDEMTLGDFMDVLGRLHKLTPAQRRAVAEVLAEPEEVQRPSEAIAQNLVATMVRIPYSQSAKIAFADAAYHWNKYTDAQRKAATKSLAIRFGRTEKAVRYQITSRIK